MITIFPVNSHHQSLIIIIAHCQVDRNQIQILLEEHIKLCLCVFLLQLKHVTFTSHNEHTPEFTQHTFDLWKGIGECNESILEVVDMKAMNRDRGLKDLN